MLSANALYEQGRAAYENDLGVSDCPFVVGSEEYNNWYSGWVDAFASNDADDWKLRLNEGT